jgi:hypothetical protein
LADSQLGGKVKKETLRKNDRAHPPRTGAVHDWSKPPGLGQGLGNSNFECLDLHHLTVVAKLFGVTEYAVLNWEKGRTEPTARNIPSPIEFLRLTVLRKSESK